MTEYKGFNFYYHHKFKKEFNKIFVKKNCLTIKEDFKLLYDILITHLEESGDFSPHICMRISGLDNNVIMSAFIIKNFRCEGINRWSRSGFRITFIYDKKNKRFIFVELFKKNKKESLNKERLNDLFKQDIKIYDELYDNERYFLNYS